jgi:hypothetical protein
MHHHALTAVLSAVVSCLLTLAVSAALRPAVAEAQPPILRVTGVELIDNQGTLRGYFGLGHVDSVGLWIHDHRGYQQAAIYNNYEDQPHLEIYRQTPDPVLGTRQTTIWQAP